MTSRFWGTFLVLVCCSALPADIILLGDSIVADVREPLFGWGELLPNHLPEYTITNRASSGASSRSYYAEYWTRVGWPFDEPVRDIVNEGDFLLIEFGHNDIPTGPPNARVEDLDEYKLWLTTIVEEVQDLDARPILVTAPEGWAHRKSGNLGPIVQRQGHATAMKEVAAALDIPLIDLHAYSVEQFAIRTEEQAITDFEAINPTTEMPTGDKTHTSMNGANIWAEFIASQFPAAELTHLAKSSPGDFNLDGSTNLIDFLILSQNYRQSFDVPDSFRHGDGNLDGVVNLFDFLVFRSEFHRTANVEAVPEPTSGQIVLLGWMLVFFGVRRRSRNRSSSRTNVG